MANYVDDFESYGAASGLPTGWTSRWDSISASTVDDSGDIFLRISGNATRRFASFDAINSDGSRVNIEILARAKASSVTANNAHLSLVLRGSGDGSSETGYRCGLFGNDFSIGKYVSAAATTLATEAATRTASTWYWVRFRANGVNATDLKAKIWTGAEDDEPEDWTIETTDSDVDAAGWAGCFQFSTGSGDFSVVAVATDGGTATTTTSGGATEKATSDALAPSLTETQASFLASGISDSVAPSLTETVALLKNPEILSVTDAFSVSLAEALTLLAVSAVTDTLVPSVTDTAALDTGTGTAEKNVTETLVPGVSESLNSLLSSSRSDTVTPAIIDTAAVIAALSRSDTLTPSVTEVQQSTIFAAVLEAFTLTLGESLGSALFSSVTDVIPVSVSDSVSLLVARTATDTLVVSVTEAATAAAVAVTEKVVSDSLSPYFTLLGQATIANGWEAGLPVSGTWNTASAAIGVWSLTGSITNPWVEDDPV